MEVCRPGLQFYAEPMAGYVHSGPGPVRGELYVVCRDGSVQSVWNPEQNVGWELIEDGDSWFYSTTDGLKPCLVRYHATSEDPPVGRSARPQNAEVIEQVDKALEVSS